MISVPLSSEAMKRLDLDECLSGDLEELQLSEEHYIQLSKSGTIEKINSSLGKVIDEFEDESIQGQVELSALLKILNEAPEHIELDIMEKIIHLNKPTLQNDTGLFFYF
ncbi:hypothetical protein [Pseudomonas lini]|uniref:hypothetical protein n=1 Tax=Pseudomonas lini TaxID=163011 RepID=UPI00345E6866